MVWGEEKMFISRDIGQDQISQAEDAMGARGQAITGEDVPYA